MQLSPLSGEGGDEIKAWRRIGWMTINDKDKLADKLESDEKEKIETAIKEALQWLQSNDIIPMDVTYWRLEINISVVSHAAFSHGGIHTIIFEADCLAIREVLRNL
nr:luminal-binding protein [Ipomoea trifida]